MKKTFFFAKDQDNNIFIIEDVFPFEKKLLIEPNQILNGHGLALDKSVCLFVGELTNTVSPYIIFVTMKESAIVYQIVIVENAHNLSESRAKWVGELKYNQTKNDKGQFILQSNDKIVLVLQRNDQLRFLFKNDLSQQLKFVALKDDGEFQIFPVENFTLPQYSTFSLLPKELMNEKELCFLWIDEQSRQHNFIQFIPNLENLTYEAVQHYSMGVNELLHPQWNYIPTSFQYTPNQNDLRDEFLFTLKYSENKNHAFLYLRNNFTLAALELSENENGFFHRVLAISDTVFSPREYYFYGILQSSSPDKEVILAKKTTTQNYFILSLEKNEKQKYEFHQTPILIQSECEDSNVALKNYLSDDGFTDRRHFLIPTQISDSNHETGSILFQIVVNFKESGDKYLYSMGLQKTQNKYQLVAHQKSFYKNSIAAKPNQNLFPKNINLKFTYIDDDEDRKWKTILIFFGVSVLLALAYSIRFVYRITNGVKEEKLPPPNKTISENGTDPGMKTIPSSDSQALSSIGSFSELNSSFSHDATEAAHQFCKRITSLETFVAASIDGIQIEACLKSKYDLKEGKDIDIIMHDIVHEIVTDVETKDATYINFQFNQLDRLTLKIDEEEDNAIFYNGNTFTAVSFFQEEKQLDPRLSHCQFLQEMLVAAETKNCQEILQRHILFGFFTNFFNVLRVSLSDTNREYSMVSFHTTNQIVETHLLDGLAQALKKEFVEKICTVIPDYLHLYTKEKALADFYQIEEVWRCRSSHLGPRM